MINQLGRQRFRQTSVEVRGAYRNRLLENIAVGHDRPILTKRHLRDIAVLESAAGERQVLGLLVDQHFAFDELALVVAREQTAPAEVQASRLKTLLEYHALFEILTHAKRPYSSTKAIVTEDRQ